MDPDGEMTTSGRTPSKEPRRIAALLFAGLLTAASMAGVNQYRYGIGDHAITVPLVKHAMDGSLYPGDPLIAEERYYYTVLWRALAVAAQAAHATLPRLFFAVYCLTLFATFLGLYRLAVTLTGSAPAGRWAAALLLFGRVTLADAGTIERILLTRGAALPFVLFSLERFLRGRYLGSAILLGAAALVHPMTAAVGAALVAAGFLARARETGWRRIVAFAGAAAAVASPVLVWRILASPPGLGVAPADPDWIEILRMRSAHHIFPLAWDERRFIEAAGVLAAGAAGFILGPRPAFRRETIAFAAAAGVLCAAGFVFSEIVPIPAILVLQPARSFQFVVYLAAASYGGMFAAALGGRGGPALLAGAAIGAGALLAGASSWIVGYALFAAAAGLVAVGRAIGSPRSQLRGGRLLKGRGDGRMEAASLICAAVVVAAGIVCALQPPRFSIENSQDPLWIDAQRWARENTMRGDRFIVPPRLEGFRIESERGIFADWKDGTLANFDPVYGREWLARMALLGVHDRAALDGAYARLEDGDFIEIARRMGAGGSVYAVLPAASRASGFEAAYRNQGFTVYRVSR